MQTIDGTMEYVKLSPDLSSTITERTLLFHASEGPWILEPKPFVGDNSGHGMLFTTFEGKRLLVIHHAEGEGPRKPRYYEFDDSGDKLVLGKRFIP